MLGGMAQMIFAQLGITPDEIQQQAQEWKAIADRFVTATEKQTALLTEIRDAVQAADMDKNYEAVLSRAGFIGMQPGERATPDIEGTETYHNGSQHIG